MDLAPDRLQKLLGQNSVTGIDFVYVHEDQTTLDVVFFQHDDTPQANDILGTVLTDQIRIYSPTGAEGLPEVPLSGSPVWQIVDNRKVLRLTTSVPGDFALYRLKIDHPGLDPYYNDLTFTFKANCKSDLDCQTAEDVCPEDVPVDFPVDYLARDFHSYRKALQDFAGQRYPDWQDRLEADVGVMLLEVMSALGDELAYYQDRIAREAYLETATQRRSLRHHARFMDYEMHNGLSASTWLDVTAISEKIEKLAAGADVWALSDTGTRIAYEVGRGLADAVNGNFYEVAKARNEFFPHFWDEDDLCLSAGATALFIQGHHKSDLVFDDPPEEPSGKWILLKTDPKNPADPARRILVRIIKVEDTRDLVLNEDITRLEWSSDQALSHELQLTELTVRGNLVPATAGRTVINRFSIGEIENGLRRAVERLSASESQTTYLFSLIRPELPDEDKGKEEAEEFLAKLNRPEGKNLTWLGPSPQDARPEIRLAEVTFDGSQWVEVKPDPEWQWRRSFIGVSSSAPADRHFTLQDGTFDRVVGYWRSGQEIVHEDYAKNEGFTIRFGNGEFGLVPARGTIFQVTYRLGNGRGGNVPADTLIHFDPGLGFVTAVTNPLAADGGQDPETAGDVRKLAPEAFRALTYRAVLPEDYAEAAERLSWVQRAGATLRWTGSWPTLFATPDPLGAVTITSEQRSELTDQLDRFRQAGRETVVSDPRYADLDLEISVCVEPFAYAGEVKQAVLEVLLGKKGASATPGFFSADNFTFGTPLVRSQLEAVIQATAGVRAVEAIALRRRGWFDWRSFHELIFEVGLDEVIRVENDPLFPARGSVRLIMDGGA